MEMANKFHQNLKNARLNSNLSQSEVARHLGFEGADTICKCGKRCQALCLAPFRAGRRK